MRRAASIILTCGMSNGFGCSSDCSAELVPTAGIEPARLKQARDFKAVGNPLESKGRLQNGPSTAHGIPPHSDPPAKRNAPAEAGTKAGAKEIIKAATISHFTTTIAYRLKATEIDRRMSVAWAAGSAVRV